MNELKYFKPIINRQLPEFEVCGVGIREPMSQGVVNRPRGTGDWLLMYFHDPVDIRVHEKVGSYPAESLMLWPNGAGHYYGNPNWSYRHSWIHFHGAEVEGIVADSGLKVGEVIPFHVPEVMEKYLELIYHEIIGLKREDRIILRNLFQNLLHEIARNTQPESSRKNPPEGILKAKRYLETNYLRRISLGQLAKLAAMSVPHFCNEFKACFGSSPIDYLIDFRLKQAEYLLGNLNLRINEVAAQVGYPDLFYFSKLFKKRYGMSPGKFRRQILL